MDKLIMSRKEREQLVIFKRLDKKEITQASAAQMLSMSVRGVRKKLKRYQLQGDSGLVHKGRGAQSAKRWKGPDRALAVELLNSEGWRGFGPTFATEQLKKQGIVISDETIRKIMIEEGLWIPGKKKGKYRKWRERKKAFGILVQLDGSPHDWFEGRGPKCTLLVFIDDATSKIVWLEFSESESFQAVALATKKYIGKYGRPLSFYVDFGSVFSVNLNNPERDKKTEFERIMKHLLIDVSHATSPQAKGRVERANKTLQDRLVKEMRLAHISSMEAANQFVQEGNFIQKHNEKFAVEPATEEDYHRSIEGYDLDALFCTQETRLITNDFTVHYKRKKFQLEQHKTSTIRPKDSVTICESLDGKITMFIRNNQLKFKEIGMRKVGKLSPVDHVLQENNISQEENGQNLPLYGDLMTSKNRKAGSEDRHFSRC
jgi:hypothetical protein